MSQPTAITLVDRKLVSRLKKQAKKLHRETGRPHHELLEELALKSGFPNWHQMSLANNATQPLEARLAKSLVIVLDVKEAFDEIGDTFELMQEALFLRTEEFLQWVSAANPNHRASSDLELLEFLNENYRALRYTGNDRLPVQDEIPSWLDERVAWMPAVVLLKGKFIDLFGKAAEGTTDERGGMDEPMPVFDESLLRKIFGQPLRGELIIGQPDTMERYEFVEGPREAWHWCLHCERAYPLGSYRQLRELQMCPYKDCDGDTVMDVWSWKRVQKENPDYPEIPTPGALYPLYGKTTA